MEKQVVKRSYLGKNYDAVHDMLRDICVRGYRKRKDFARIGVKGSKFDNLRCQILCMLNETDVSMCGEGKQGITFSHEPMLWQNNALAETFRYVIPDAEDFFYYFVILQALNECKYLKGEKFLTVHDICGEWIEDYYDDKEQYEYNKQVRRKLEELEAHGIVKRSEYTDSENQIQYKLLPYIWEDFTPEELLDIHTYLSFLQNTMPLELPFYMLQKNLEWWARSETQLSAVYKKMQQDIFLFKHHNPVNVIDSEAIYAFLMIAKEREVARINGEKLPVLHAHDRRNIYEQTTPRILDSTKYYKSCAWVVALDVDKISYDCLTGEIRGISEAGKEYTTRGIVFYKEIGFRDWKMVRRKRRKLTKNKKLRRNRLPKFEKETIKKFHKRLNARKIIRKQLKKLPDTKIYGVPIKRDMDEKIKFVFNRLNSIYLERFLELNCQEEWSEKELRNHFFHGRCEYEDIYQELVGKGKKSKNRKKNVFYKEKDKFVWYAWTQEKLFLTPRLAREAFANIPNTEYVNAFLEEETIAKIQAKTKDFKCLWDVKHIEWKNRASHNSCLQNKEIKSLIKHYREHGVVYVDGKKYEMVRIQYSNYYDEFRVLVKGNEGLTFLKLHQIDLRMKLNDVACVREKFISQAELSTLMEVKTKMLEFSLVPTINGPSMFFDNSISEQWMMLLSSYKRNITYVNPKPNEQSGTFEVKLWYWDEDKEKIQEEFRKMNAKYYEIKIT